MSLIATRGLTKRFGTVTAVSDLGFDVDPGVVGLIGANGAGKSTLINMISGFLEPSAGSVTLDGDPVWRNESVYHRIGLVPEREAMYDVVSGWQFLLANARLHGLSDPEAAARRALDTVEMSAFADRDLDTYSNGMKQRIKIATAVVHDPDVLLLDEPFNGMDPRQRIHLMDLLQQMGADGRTVLFSSRILEEVEQIAGSIEVVVAGRHAASGGYRDIRRLMTERPHQYWIRSDDDRALAAALMSEVSASGVQLLAAKDAAGRLARPHPASGPATANTRCTSRPPTSPPSCACCRRWPTATASASTRCPPPTNRSRASSPTW